MTLAEQLARLLSSSDLLPTDPANAVMGPELLERVRDKLDRVYEDSSIRQTFSTLSKDPESPIARLASGFGYYRRPPIAAQAAPDDIGEDPTDDGDQPRSDATGRDAQPEEKFRALIIRLSRLQNRFPVHVEHSTGTRQPAGVNKWKFPDIVILDWDAAKGTDEGVVLDSAILEVKRSLGEQPFRLSSIELKAELSLGTFREFFFQCVSNSRWAHSAQLAVAAPITDSLLADELRRLGASYGVNVVSYNLTRETIATFPTASYILAASDGEIATLAKKLSPEVLATGAARTELDWAHLRDMMTQHATFSELFDWIARCLRDGVPYAFDKYHQLREIERTPT